MLATIWDGIVWFFTMIFKVLGWLFMGVYYTIYYLGEALGFCWYPIKENVANCCRNCSNNKNRANDPNYSPFDNEV